MVPDGISSRAQHPEGRVMATAAQLNANRLNCQKSQGPTSVRARQISARNSLKHGLTGAGTVLAEGDEPALQDRLQAYTAEFRPESPHEFILVAEMALD